MKLPPEVVIIMPWKEWSLIVNSLMIQFAVGLLTYIALCRWVYADSHLIITLTTVGVAFTGTAILIGMGISLFHLGKPSRAHRAVFNLKTSWLSREVLLTAIFLMLWIAAFLLEQRNGVGSAIFTWSAVAAGHLCVWCMSGIYGSTSITGWHGWNTHINFFNSVLFYGSVSGACMILGAGQEWLRFKGLVGVSLLAALLMLVVRLGHQNKFIKMLRPNSPTGSLDRLVAADSIDAQRSKARRYKILAMWSGIPLLAAVGILLYIFIMNEANTSMLIVVTCMLLSAGELLGRLGFYSLWHEPDEKCDLDRPDRDGYGRYIGCASHVSRPKQKF